MPQRLSLFAVIAAVVVIAGAIAYLLLRDDDGPAGASGRTAPMAAAATASSTVSPLPPSATAAPTPTAAARSPLPTRGELRSLAARAAAGAGRVQVAVTTDAGTRVVSAASSGGTGTAFRMWSVSKVATAIALLEARGWGERAGPRLRVDVDAALRDALIGSSDCAQRQLVVELQDAVGGLESARRAVQGVLRASGARSARVLPRTSAAGTGCRPYLERTRTPDPYRVALQLGTAEWTITDAARFALALGDGSHPAAIERRILRLLRHEKQHSVDPFARGLDVTSRLDWGAGEALRGLSPAYKAGWGGSSGETATFVNEQVVYVRSRAGQQFGIAVSYEPARVPARDDPGLSRAPVALAQVLRALRGDLRL